MPKGRGASRAFAIATAQCIKMGKTGFKKGSAGQKCRSRVAEAVVRPRGRKGG